MVRISIRCDSPRSIRCHSPRAAALRACCCYPRPRRYVPL